MTPRERMIFDLGEACGRAIRDGLSIAEVGDVLRFVVSRFEPPGGDGEVLERPCRTCGSLWGEACKDANGMYLVKNHQGRK
jgi:hypothetical protein